MITIDARWYRASGIGTYIRNLVPRLIAQMPDERFALLGDPTDLNAYQSARVEVVPFVTKMYSLRKIPIPRETSLYFSPHYTIPLTYAGPMVVTVNDVLHLARPEFAPGFAKRIYAKAMFTAVKYSASRVICISEFSADELRQRTDIKATVIHDGVGQEWFGEHPRQLERPYIIYVGNVKPHKNLKRLIAAYRVIATETLMRGRPPFDLVIVGKRDGFITGERFDQTPGVTFTGYVSDRELMGWVQHAKALVFPSLYEGFGLPPLEAMACGCPAVVSKIGPMPEICGDAAVYCDPLDVDSIAAAIKEAIRCTWRYRDRGIARARMFSWDKCAAKTCAVFREVMIEGGRAVHV